MKDVKDVEWDTKAFGKFALCSDMKKLLADLISGHTSSECTYEDMVAGKGTGLSVALSGASGSGKTSLVYALAEKHHKAVLEFTLAKLDEYKFEDKLRDLFELGAATQSIVLLNEVCQWLETAAAEEWKQYMLLSKLFFSRPSYYVYILGLIGISTGTPARREPWHCIPYRERSTCRPISFYSLSCRSFHLNVGAWYG